MPRRFYAAPIRYTGGTFITAGRLETEITPSALGTGDVTITGAGQLFIDSPETQPYTQNFFISGIGTGEAGGHGAMRINSAPIDGTITLIGDARITRRGGTGTINGRITGGFNLELGGYDNDANSTITLTNVSNDWTGDTRISQASTVRLGANEVLPHGAGKGNLLLNVSTDPQRNAVLDLNGVNETINGLSRIGATGERAFIRNTLAATVATLTVGDNNQGGSFDGTIEGPLTAAGDIAITKIGSGLLTLGGPNHYAGATTIEAGELAVTGRLATLGLVGVSGAVLVNTSPSGGATLSGRGDGATTGLVGSVTLAAINSGNRARIAPGATSALGSNPGVLVVDSLAVGDGAQLLFDLVDATNPANNDRIDRNVAAAGTVTFENSAQILLSGGSAGEYVLVNNNGTPITYTAGTGAITLVPNANPLVRPSNYALDFGETDKIKVDVTGGALSLVWNGTAGNNKWDINTTAAWRNPSNSPDVFFNNDAVTFDDAAAVKTVELDAVVQPASIKVTTNGGTYTIQDVAGPTGSITGNAGIDMSASTNATLIVAAELQNSGPTNTGIGNTLQVGTGGTVGRLGPGDINNDGTLIFNRSDALAVPNLINGSGGVRQDGTGTLTLSAANGYGGGLTVNSGAARLTNATAGGFGTITVNSAGTLVVSAAQANPIVT